MMVRLFSRDAVAKFPCTCGSLPGIYKDAAFDRFIDLMAKMVEKYGSELIQNKN